MSLLESLRSFFRSAPGGDGGDDGATSGFHTVPGVETSPLAANASALEAKAVERIVAPVLKPPVERLSTLGEVATGGMAGIEDGHDRGLGRRVAVKVLHPHFQHDPRLVSWFVREAQITGQLDHPNVVPVYEMGRRRDGRVFFTMKFVEGRTLQEIVASRPAGRIARADLFDLLDIVRKVCDALAFAHSRGVVHRDVKPQNIMVADFGQVYLMDWGIAKFGRRDDAPPSETGKRPALLTGAAMATGGSEVTGTPGFMAPEQARAMTVDHRSDIFSVGAVLYYGLSGAMPYPGTDLSSVLFRASQCDFPPLDQVLGDDSGVPGSLVRIVHRAMAADPADRYDDVAELEAALVGFLRGGGDFPIVNVAAGDVIVREGEIGDRAYIVDTGSCEIFRTEQGEKETLSVVGPGEVFGETAILAAGPRTASVVALEDCTLRELTQDVLLEEVAGLKPWMQVVLRSIADRFRIQMAIGASPAAPDGDGHLAD